MSLAELWLPVCVNYAKLAHSLNFLRMTMKVPKAKLIQLKLSLLAHGTLSHIEGGGRLLIAWGRRN